MLISKRFFPKVLPDNEIAYFAHLEGVISSVDELALLEVTKNPNSYHFRLVTSHPKYNEMLLEEILRLHNLFQLHLNLSKSIKSSATITFEIDLNQ